MSTTACDYKLAASVGASCENPVKKGVKNTCYIMNFDDVNWDTIEYATVGSGETAKTNPNIVKTFALKSGAKAYTCYVPGKTPFTGTQKALATGTYRNKFTKTVSLVIMDNGGDVSRNIIDQLANGRFVVIMENNYQGGAQKDNAFEFYGLETGLAATEMSDEKYSEDTDGGWAVTLEESDAPTSGIFFLMAASDGTTPIEVTRAAINTLVNPSAGG